ncbi:hypothetical protein AQUCO_04300086v1 [Aquilegia coerulea]|uniref:Uncharacterized protein n=1 Tax=Aquilegia coerulea TaxID=218851 RepID=A0A2G5CNZ1_AQUCA|nr:hypothetical protein AQUCO_04300086v1 [Aquilegia coerulea]
MDMYSANQNGNPTLLCIEIHFQSNLIKKESTPEVKDSRFGSGLNKSMPVAHSDSTYTNMLNISCRNDFTFENVAKCLANRYINRKLSC